MQTKAGAKKAVETKRKKAEQRIWDDVLVVKADYPGCTCKIKKGMDWEALSKLAPTCTEPNFVCPVVDKYRREIIKAGGYPDYSEEFEDDTC